MHFYFKYELPAIVNEGAANRILVFGDSFAQLARMPKHVRQESWISHLALQLDAEIHSYGISGGAEPTTLYCYQQTYNANRDYTIIFHTQPTRSDQYYDLRDLTLHDYERWDKALEKHSCLHIYWTDAQHYKFTNGQNLSCDYWTNLYEKDSKGDLVLTSVIARNHMNLEDNKHFATDVYNKIKGEF